jgi:DNA-binding HxlR family transcriptional regulator
LGGQGVFTYSMTANLRPTPADAPSRERRASRAESQSTSYSESDESGERSPDVPFEELLALFGDEYACDLLRALEDGPRAASDLIEHCEMSRPTVYRRLDRLTDAGIVESRMAPARDGHHRQEFQLACDEVELRVREDGIDGTVRPTDD